MSTALLSDPANQTVNRKKQFSGFATKLELVRAEGDLPAGVCGRMQGIALVYETVDFYDTMFAYGCMDRSIAERVASRKVNVFSDHVKQVRAHVGVVSMAETIGDSLVVMIDLLDTADGRQMLEYVKACVSAGVETGLSIGFIPRKYEQVKSASGELTGVVRFTEIEWRELSVTPVPAVPGTAVTGARHEDVDAVEQSFTREDAIALFSGIPEELLNDVLSEMGYTRTASADPENDSSDPKPKDDTPEADAVEKIEGEERKFATMDERMAALRSSFSSATITSQE